MRTVPPSIRLAALAFLAGCAGREVSYQSPPGARSASMSNPTKPQNRPAGGTAGENVATSSTAPAPAQSKATGQGAVERANAGTVSSKENPPPAGTNVPFVLRDVHGRAITLQPRREQLVSGAVFELLTLIMPAPGTGTAPERLQRLLTGGAAAEGWQIADMQQDARGNRYFTFRRFLGNALTPPRLPRTTPVTPSTNK